MFSSQGTAKRAAFGLLLFIGWLLFNALALPWIFQFPLMVLLLSLFPFVLMFGYFADSFAGERERGTLEVLLLSPVPDSAIIYGKTIALVMVWLLICAVLLTAHAIIGGIIGGGVLLRWYALSFAVSAMVSIIVTCLGLIVSWRAPSVQAAQQTFSYAFVALTIVAMLYLYLPVEITRLVQHTHPVLFVIMGVCVALGSLIVAVRTFDRDQLLLR